LVDVMYHFSNPVGGELIVDLSETIVAADWYIYHPVPTFWIT
jgi:hypothetical protein